MSAEKASESVPKTKQERIRDNQRRSRARRQEYLADLERRLAECQVTCREADLQRAAYLELQIENTCLRELLSLAGVNEEVVDSYVSRAVSQAGQFKQDNNPSFRQLKPNLKFGSTDSTKLISSTLLSKTVSEPSTRSGSSASFIPAASIAVANVASSQSPTTYADSPVYALPEVQSMFPTSVSNWQLPQTTSSDFFCTPGMDNNLFCNSFGVFAEDDLPAADGNAIHCSVAKDMLAQYNVSVQEMDEIKGKLSTALRRPSLPGAECGVDNTILFQILNDLSVRDV